MKKLLFLLLFTSTFYAQQDSVVAIKPKISVISADKMNILYRGIPNPISIAVNNAKSFKIKGQEITKNEDGTYSIKPRSGNETKITLEIESLDSTKVVEEHVFKVKPLPTAALLVNQKGCLNTDCVVEIPTKELLNAEVSIKMIDFFLDYTISITGFRLYLTNTNGDTLASYEITGNKIPQDVYDEIIKNDKANLIIIHKITFTSDLNLSVAKTPVIKIKKV
ncbi:hypothetical protein [Flavobacterium sp. GCM10027622]|uniref:hypothetical protein n=1 Tax=unclassified Flavobacterium TaxID=196869 RepID=UPI0036179E44